ncbi:MAG: hypothetical protein EOR16_31145 [Mesorhizobium sp.]|uniref:hypothetical protein n=1 Tax=Mesorhizobium sp. TaxID=1871066 RepID=UPI000FE6A502|nr:hypothetical protein [Mesorhizobium sp.]RWI50105.1 MAG: hypothetical protein EOR16_31145 [Mesorhizobium sp.]
MLPAITVDPSIIWILDDSDTEETASVAITRALEWMRPTATAPLDLLLSGRSVDALAAAGAFPSEPRLAQILSSLGLENVISPKTLAMSVSRFLSSTAWIEDEIGISDVLFHNTSIDPDPTPTISAPGLRVVSVDTIVLAGICAQENRRYSIYAFPRQPVPHRRLSVATTIDILEFVEDEPLTEQAIEVDLEAIRSPDAWYQGVSGVQVWRDAGCAADLEVAIWLTASELEKASGGGLREFRVGTAFLQTLQACGAARDGPHAEAVLTKCAQTVLGKSNLRPKPFWTSTARTSVRERERDKAKAWRQQVTKSHEALRLMYWESPNGLIEFATLEAKAEETIDDGEVLDARGW